MKQYIEKCLAGEHLTADEASEAVERIMAGDATEAQIGGLLVALRCKGETVDEILGFARVMRSKALPVSLEDEDAIDIVGTGGDSSGTFNISTAAAIIVAGAGVTVAKHGNRAVSSKSGSADVLTTLGVNIQIPPERVEACINSTGIGFMFAPVFHPATKVVAKPRMELGVRTIFNMLGPLTNPARVRRGLIGAFSHSAAERMAGVFDRLEMRKVYVVHSKDGLDEISPDTGTFVFELGEKNPVTKRLVKPEDFGLPNHGKDSVTGGDIETNAHIITRVLEGEKSPYRDVVVMNSAAALLVAEKAGSIREAVNLAEESIDSGKAADKLRQLIQFTNRK